MVVDEKSLGSRFGAENSLKNVDCDSYVPTPNFWLSPKNKVGDEAYFVVRLACMAKIKGFLVKNTANAHNQNRYNIIFWQVFTLIVLRGTKDFSIYFKASKSNPWNLVLTGELEDARGKSCEEVKLEKYLMQETHSANFVKFQIDTFFGEWGGGIKYFSLIPGN